MTGLNFILDMFTNILFQGQGGTLSLKCLKHFITRTGVNFITFQEEIITYNKSLQTLECACSLHVNGNY